MKGLHVAETIKGGIATYLNDLVPLQQADDAFEDVRVLAPRQHLEEIPLIPSSSRVEFKRLSRAAGVFGLATVFIRELYRNKPDIIHVHSTFAGIIARVAALLVPSFPAIVYCPHGWGFDRGGSAFLRGTIRLLEVALASRANKIVAISSHEFARGLAIGIASKRMTVIRNGRREEQTVAKPSGDSLWRDNRRKVLFVGRLDVQKGIDILLKAVDGLEQSIAVYVIGEKVVSRISMAAATFDHVRYLGWRDTQTVSSYLTACDVVVMPSRWEGFGLVALEAMRAGKPVIASAVGGLMDIVVDGETGCLIPPEDVGALRAALLRLSDQELAAMGARGLRRFTSFFTIERVHREVKNLYSQILTEKKVGLGGTRPSPVLKRSKMTPSGTPARK